MVRRMYWRREPVVMPATRRKRSVYLIEGPRGAYLLLEALFGITSYFNNAVGFVTTEAMLHSRFWRHRQFDPYRGHIAWMLRECNLGHIPLYTGRFKQRGTQLAHPEFMSFLSAVNAEECYMAGCGWEVPKQAIDFVNGEWFNTHPTRPSEWNVSGVDMVPEWPSPACEGPTPWENLLAMEETRCTIVMYRINEHIDKGEEVVGYSDWFDCPYIAQSSEEELGRNVLMMHNTARPYTAQVMRRFLLEHRAHPFNDEPRGLHFPSFLPVMPGNDVTNPYPHMIPYRKAAEPSERSATVTFDSPNW